MADTSNWLDDELRKVLDNLTRRTAMIKDEKPLEELRMGEVIKIRLPARVKANA